ncbi:MAG: aldo/keto reductase [Candidatus Saccharibacteria bacterium]|nr:aldo/keto reductase [Candidatus Saccharibacteria bacterium]
MKLDINSKVKLNDGTQMPLLGFGTWQIRNGESAYNAVLWALKAGYRHIDTAKFYGNEESVGRAIRDSGIPRSDVFVTTKLWPTDAINAEKVFNRSFEKLDIGYIDLYLMHWPVPGMVKKSWQRLEKIYETSGKIKSIGVSNHNIRQLKCILDVAKIKPVVNQVKCSPYNYDPTMHEFCRKNDIVMEAYSPLTRGNMLYDEKLTTIAEKYKKSSTQILLRWCIQKGIVTIPKSAHPEWITENADIFDFEISDDDMRKLDNFSKNV